MDLERRLTAVEDRLAIGQLPIRYALAVDGRDLDAWVELFAPDVDCGRHGRGREALRSYIEPHLRWFYRSLHQICGHRIELVDEASATGKTYCRAEHEVGDRFVVMGICYDDRYTKVDGEWFFARRKELHWYAADVLERPPAVGFNSWERAAQPALPQAFPTWSTFWAGADTTAVTDWP
ncbi:nuclear transport factor 2 family protein [Nocardia sp. CA-135953]|uniref:nuclear transport factor 2 family protein n=1 Tax=Nocardia sp. CA-135953 TaxID=3239978 RepID=UPI003D998D49